MGIAQTSAVLSCNAAEPKLVDARVARNFFLRIRPVFFPLFGTDDDASCARICFLRCLRRLDLSVDRTFRPRRQSFENSFPDHWISQLVGCRPWYQPLGLEVLLFTTFGPFMVLTGTIEVVAGRIFRNEFNGTVWLTVLGFIAFLLGMLIVIQPFAGFSAVEELIGLAQIIRGVIGTTIAFSFRELRTTEH